MLIAGKGGGEIGLRSAKILPRQVGFSRLSGFNPPGALEKTVVFPVMPSGLMQRWRNPPAERRCTTKNK